MDLEKCMSCGSDDIAEEFANDDIAVCESCDARHHWFDGRWHCADGDGVRGIQAAQADVERGHGGYDDRDQT